MVNPKLNGRRSVVLKRCSTKGQTGTSINNQAVGMERLIADNEMIIVKEIDLAGVTGSVPGAREDIDQILDLKRSGADFDLLLLPNTDRFTRAGQGHGNHLLWELEGAGIAVYFAAEGLFSDDRMHRMILSFMFDAAQQTAIAISRGATLGSTNSYLDGRSPHAQTPIYGLDRLYSVDGKAMHVIRSLADGTQQMLDPTTGDFLRTFGKNPKKGTPCHYIKQKNESVRFVPGDPARVAIVHLLFELVYVQRRSFHSIAKQLNDGGIPSPRGVEWDGEGVKNITTNPTYVGLLRRGRTTSAIYFKAAKGAPAPSDVDAMELRTFRKPRTRLRPSDEWLLREDPILAEFLPPPLREIARPIIEKRLQSESAGKPPAPASKDRHRSSDFFLKNILRSKQGNYPMTGKRSGRHGEKRYYGPSRGRRLPKTNSLFNRSVPATPLEEALLEVLREILQNKGDLAEALRCAAEDYARQQPQPTEDAAQVEKTLMKKQKEIAVALEHLTGNVAFDAPIEARLAEYRAEVARLTTALRSSPKAKEPIDIDAAVAHLTSLLADFGSNLDATDKAIVHEMFGLLVHRLEADLETRETEIELALPGWMGSAMSDNGMMSLDRAFACKTLNEAHRDTAIVLAEFRCKTEGIRPVCYSCRRVKRAA